jgi:hypothetical protein
MRRVGTCELCVEATGTGSCWKDLGVGGVLDFVCNHSEKSSARCGFGEVLQVSSEFFGAGRHRSYSSPSVLLVRIPTCCGRGRKDLCS